MRALYVCPGPTNYRYVADRITVLGGQKISGADIRDQNGTIRVDSYLISWPE